MRKAVLTILAACLMFGLGGPGWGGASRALAAEEPAGAAVDAVVKADPQGVKEITPGKTGPGTVSVSLESADLRAVVTALARANNINLVGSDKLTGKVTLHLTDAPVLDALIVILKNAGFVLTKKDNGMYEVMTEAESLKADGAAKVKIFTIKFADIAQVAKVLVPSALPDASSIAANPATNQLIVSGTEEQLRKAEQIIKAVDTPLPQVAIEARIIEVFVDRAKSLGVSLTLAGKSKQFGGEGVGTVGIDLTQSAVQSATFDATFLSDRVDGLISTLTQKDVAEVLSAPRVTTGHGRQAEIKIVDQEPVITRTTRVVDQVTVTDETVTFQETGVTLTVTPRVLADDRIEMIVEPSVKELTGTTDTDPPVPIINTRSAKTQVTISDGKWLVIGGLMRYSERERERGVPLLKDIPLLGWFFKTTYTVREKSNLVIFVAATVLDDKKAEQDADAEQSKIRTHREKHGLKGGPFPPAGGEAPVPRPEPKKGN
ncbi:MAG: secretin N-terminal domain-containing protein [Planctomycetota bacterium]